MRTSRLRGSTADRSWSSDLVLHEIATLAATQAAAFDFYRAEAARLAAAGWYPVAHSWGDERTSVGFAAVLGDVAATQLSGTLLVTYRQGGRA